MKAFGMVLIAIGLVGLLWGGIRWTQSEKVVDLGPLQVNREERKALPIPPIAGALCVVAGAGLLMAGRRTA
ncbi:MAG TPA: hypothetical protein VFO19_18010 [Vicinamibacterales bacterium]|nr:hypothetical protein [Vicinamibacterales bacterium]